MKKLLNSFKYTIWHKILTNFIELRFLINACAILFLLDLIEVIYMPELAAERRLMKYQVFLSIFMTIHLIIAVAISLQERKKEIKLHSKMLTIIKKVTSGETQIESGKSLKTILFTLCETQIVDALIPVNIAITLHSNNHIIVSHYLEGEPMITLLCSNVEEVEKMLERLLLLKAAVPGQESS